MYKSLSFFFCLVPLFLFSQKIQNKKTDSLLQITGQLIDFKDCPKFIYSFFVDGNRTGFDSVLVKNGKYSIKRIIQASTLVTLYAKNPDLPGAYNAKYILSFYTEPCAVSIVSKDSLPNSKITGSKANMEHSRLSSMCKQQTKQLTVLYNAKGKNKNDTGINRQIDSVNNIIAAIYYNYLLRNQNSLIKPFVLFHYLFSLPDTPDKQQISNANSVYDKFSIAEKNSYNGKQVKRKLNSYKIEVGMIAPEFTQNDTLGNPVSLKNYRGKYVLVDFWASWCAPCRGETPYLKNCFDKYKDKGFTIISISLDDDKEKWVNAVYKDNMTWTQLCDFKIWDNKAVKLYRVNAIPSNFLIDPSGKIIAKSLRGADLGKQLQKIFLWKN